MRQSNWTKETAPKGKGRGATKYTYTLADIAKVSDKTIGTIRNDICKGKINPLYLSSIIKYINSRKNSKTTANHIIAWLKENMKSDMTWDELEKRLMKQIFS